MDEKHPKRRRDKYNPYRIAEEKGHYFVSFKDDAGVPYRIEVDKPLYDVFNRFELDDLSYLNIWDRYIEQSELTEVSLNKRAVKSDASIEEVVIENIQSELLHKKISELPKVQRRRLTLYFSGGLTYEQIAKMEGCTKMPVKRSIDRAIEELRKKLLK